MTFHSDNETGVAPEIFAAMAAVNDGVAMPYGADAWSGQLNASLSKLFETEVEAYLAVTGTASNALALSTMVPPYGAIYCHRDAHILVDECGGPEFYCGGARLIPLAGQGGKLEHEQVRDTLASQRRDVHHVKPTALSLTQATEWGTLYTPSEVRALAELAHDHDLYVHMDGTRFANAVVSLGCSPAELSWRSGVDALCFGASKNGAMAAEVIVFFRRELSRDFRLRRKRGGHLLSKMRFVAAQFEAYLEDARWARYAGHANRMARKLEAAVTALAGVTLAYPVEANLVFVNMPRTLLDRLYDHGHELNYWPGSDGTVLVRFVTAFNTRDEDVNALMRGLREDR